MHMNHPVLRTACTAVLAALLIASCSRNGDQDLAKQAVELGKKNDTRGAIAKFEELVEEYPDSPLAPEALYEIGVLQSSIEELSAKAIPTLESMIATYPSSPVVHKAVFVLGYLYNNRFGNLEKAKLYYERYLRQFPDSIYAKDARMELQNLGKTPEEILQQAQAARQAEGNTPSQADQQTPPPPKKQPGATK